MAVLQHLSMVQQPLSKYNSLGRFATFMKNTHFRVLREVPSVEPRDVPMDVQSRVPSVEPSVKKIKSAKWSAKCRA